MAYRFETTHTKRRRDWISRLMTLYSYHCIHLEPTTEKDLQECPRLNLTGNNECNPTSVLLGSTVSINRIKPETGFKEKMITLLPQKIAQTTRFDYALYDLPTRQTSSSTGRHTKISVELLNDQFRIGTEIANATLRSPLQRGTISAILLIIRRYR